MIGLTMILFGGMWICRFWFSKPVECFKCCLMGHSSRSMEDSDAEADLNRGGLAHEVSEEKSGGTHI